MPRHDRYRFRRIKVDGPWCIYCGMLADTEDHFPPLSVSISGFLLPACRLCNNLASTLYPFDFQARVRHVQEELVWRFGGDLAMPHWTTEEITKLGPNLQRYIELCRERKNLAHGRIVWNAREYLRSIAPANVFAAINAKTLGIQESEPTPSRPSAPVELKPLVFENNRICLVCRQTFRQKRRQQKYCCRRCQHKATNHKASPARPGE